MRCATKRARIAWHAIEDEAADLRLDETQKRQLSKNLQKARHDLKESVWRSFKHVLLLGKDNTLRQVDSAWCILAQRALRQGDLGSPDAEELVRRIH
jgi:hypothetical protein